MILVYDGRLQTALAGFEVIEDAHIYIGALLTYFGVYENSDRYYLTHEPFKGKMKIVQGPKEAWAHALPHVDEGIAKVRNSSKGYYAFAKQEGIL